MYPPTRMSKTSGHTEVNRKAAQSVERNAAQRAEKRSPSYTGITSGNRPTEFFERPAFEKSAATITLAVNLLKTNRLELVRSDRISSRARITFERK
jgi:hypothetical protein